MTRGQGCFQSGSFTGLDAASADSCRASAGSLQLPLTLGAVLRINPGGRDLAPHEHAEPGEPVFWTVSRPIPWAGVAVSAGTGTGAGPRPATRAARPEADDRSRPPGLGGEAPGGGSAQGGWVACLRASRS